MARRPVRRERQPRLPIEFRREQILDAALTLIAERGYPAATMDAIAAEANIAKPVLYNAFRGRGALLYALLEREEQRGLGALASAMPPQPPGSDPTDLLLSWLDSLAHAIAAHPNSWRLILLPPESTPHEVRERVRTGREFALKQAQALASALVGKRPALAGLDTELLGHSLFAICESSARLMLEDPAHYPAQRMIDYAKQLLRSP